MFEQFFSLHLSFLSYADLTLPSQSIPFDEGLLSTCLCPTWAMHDLTEKERVHRNRSIVRSTELAFACMTTTIWRGYRNTKQRAINDCTGEAGGEEIVQKRPVSDGLTGLRRLQ